MKTALITILLTLLFLPAWCILWLKISDWIDDNTKIDPFLIYLTGCLILPVSSALFLIIKYVN